MTVRELMRPGLVTCPPSAGVAEVAALLVREGVHAVVVVDAVGAPVGVVADIDLLAGEWLATDDDSLAALRALTADDLATAPVRTISASATIAEAARALAAEHLGRLVVQENGTAVGVVSVSDVVASVASAPAARRSVEDVMSHGLVVCRRGTAVGEVARAMRDRRSRSVIVAEDDGRPAGVVTGTDLVAAVAQGSLPATVDELMHEPVTIGPAATLREAADLMLQHEIHRLVVVDPATPAGMPLGLLSTSDIVAEMATAAAWR
jgi:CBS domain-containing protein